MSQEPEDEVEISIEGAIFTTEAELRAWYIATNPMLRSVGLSCPAKLYREMQRDLRDFDATVAIVPVPEDMDEALAQRVLDEFTAVGKAKRKYPRKAQKFLRMECVGPVRRSERNKI